MRFKSDTYKIKSIIDSTKTRGISDIKVGDTVSLSYEIDTYTKRNGLYYAPRHTLRVNGVNTGYSFTPKEVHRAFRFFDMEPVVG